MFLLPSAIGAIQQDPIRRIFKQASLDLQFAEKKSLVDATTGSSLVTFTRASSGTFVGSDGLIRTAVTNLLLRSEEFGTTWVPTRSSVSSDSATAPNGAATADKLVEDSTATNTHSINQGSISFTTGLAYTFSCYVKEAGRQNVRITLPSAAFTSALNAQFNLTNGSITATSAGVTSSVQDAGDGWYRCIVTATATTTATGGPTIFIGETATATTISYTGDGTSGLFLWGAQLEQSSSVGEYIPTTSTINSAPRFDHNPTTGESLGLLVEEQRANSITNNTGVGAVAGTPGTNPTGWFLTASANGISPTIVGTGVEDGITYVDIQYSGTSTGAGSVSILASLVTAITAATGQSWTGSAYVKLQAGSLVNLTNVLTSVNGRSDIGAGLESVNLNYTPTSSRLGIQRRAVSITLANASTARISHTIFNAAYASGVAIDITIRIGLPQLEQGAFATSVIPTTTAAVTRSADVASISGSNFSSWYRQDEGTVFVEGGPTNPTLNKTQLLLTINDGSANNRAYLGKKFNSTTAVEFGVASGGVGQAFILTTPSSVSNARLATGYKVNDFAIASSGGTLATDTSGSVPVSNTQLLIGTLDTASNNIGGHIRRLTYWPTRLPNSTLQAVTQ